MVTKGDEYLSDINTSLYTSQATDVEQMTSQLLAFDRTDANAARKAIQNVTLLRVYHQLKRIVRFLDMIDKLEDRIYQSIDAKLENSDPDDENLWFTLIPIQERLQKTMVESHKLLEPYLNMEQLATLSVPKEEDPATSFTSMILDQESREKVRTGVQELLSVINTFDATASQVDKDDVKSRASEVLAELNGSSEENNPDA